MSTIKALVKCVACKAKKEISPGDVAPGDIPYCDKCFMPMVAISVKVKLK